MTRTPFIAVASPLAPAPNLLGAALAGLLCLAGCSSNDSPSTPGAAGDASHAGAGNVGGAESEGGSAGAGGDATTAGSSATGGDASAGSAAGGVGSGGESAGGVPSSAGAGGAAGAGGSAEEPPHITSSENVGVLTEEQFKALCDARDGTVEVMPHCGGFATAAGFSYDTGTQLLSEHTCAGANTCGGWNCIVPE